MKTTRVPFPQNTPLSLTTMYGSTIAPFLSPATAPLPYLMTFVVTRRCNSRCKMCNIWQDKGLPELSLDQIKTIFGRGFPSIQVLTLTGGEATLRLDLPEIVQTVLPHMPNLQLLFLPTHAMNTELTLRHVEKILTYMGAVPNKLKRLQVQISLDGVGDMHDDIRGIDGYFDKVMKTVKGLDALKARFPNLLNYRFHMVVMPKNMGMIPEVKALVKSLGSRISFSPIVISGAYFRNVDQQPDLTFVTGTQQAMEASRILHEIAKDESSPLRYYYDDVAEMVNGEKRNRRCMLGYYGFVLEHDGRIYPCVEHEVKAFGNLLEKPFEDIWFSDYAVEVRTALAKKGCPNCPAISYQQPASFGEVAGTALRRAAKKLGK